VSSINDQQLVTWKSPAATLEGAGALTGPKTAKPILAFSSMEGIIHLNEGSKKYLAFCGCSVIARLCEGAKQSWRDQSVKVLPR
jgi:hypothetical protein